MNHTIKTSHIRQTEKLTQQTNGPHPLNPPLPRDQERGAGGVRARPLSDFFRLAHILRLLLLIMTLILSSCGRIQNPLFTGEADGENIPADITLEVELASQDALQLGEAADVEILLEQNGQPVEGATIQIEGNMTHAGMEPVLIEAQESAPGQYHATLDWTMGGGWIVTVWATLPDGQTAERVIENLQVDSQ